MENRVNAYMYYVIKESGPRMPSRDIPEATGNRKLNISFLIMTY